MIRVSDEVHRKLTRLLGEQMANPNSERNRVLFSWFLGCDGSLSGLVEKALEELLDRNKVPKMFEQKTKELS
jgi:hypothetical protein